MQVLVFYHQYKANKNINGPGWWLLWSAFETLAFLLMLLRTIPLLLPLVIVFQDGIVLAGTIFVYIGVLRFFDNKVVWKFIIPFFLVFIVLHQFFFFIKDDIQIRTLILDLFLSSVGFLTGICIYRNKFKAIAQTASFNMVIFFVHGCIFVYRSVMIITGTSVTAVFSPNLFNFIQYFDALVVGLLWTFGFIIMLNQRLNSEISEAKTHFEQIFNTSPDAVVITRLRDGLFVDCNENFTRISGFSKKNIIGKSVLDFNIWKNPDERGILLKKIAEQGFCENDEILFQRKNGEVFTGLLSANTIMLKGINHLLSVTRDITDLKLAEAEIKLKNEELQKINAVKDKLFSIIAHDLRSPFTTILGYIDLLQMNLHKYPVAEIEEMIEAIQISAKNSYKLLENLLNWAKTQTEQMQLNLGMVNIDNVINDVISFVKVQAIEKNISITYNQGSINPIITDENIVNTVLRNLIINAVKFTNRQGLINIKAIEKEEFVEIEVSDNGIGMTEETINAIFVDIVHNSQRGTNQEKGTGLGLTICKEFIEKLGGKIWVESELDKGSSFYFTIPVRKLEN